MNNLIYQLKWSSMALEAARLTGNRKTIERQWLIRESIIDCIFNQLEDK